VNTGFVSGCKSYVRNTTYNFGHKSQNIREWWSLGHRRSRRQHCMLCGILSPMSEILFIISDIGARIADIFPVLLLIIKTIDRHLLFLMSQKVTFWSLSALILRFRRCAFVFCCWGRLFSPLPFSLALFR
jgi:hypothetical protein